ncbi:MAG TPA: TetR/AcrR family transcriptional regulator [Clostridiaceae bacterium]
MYQDQLKLIYKEAGYLFTVKGYGGTQISQIAKAVGIATGSIYNIFKSKKAVLTFVLRCSLDKEYIESNITFPIEEMNTRELINIFHSNIEKGFELINLSTTHGTVKPGFKDMLSNLFDLEAEYRVAFNVINANYDIDCVKELASLFYFSKARMLEVFEKNIDIYIKNGEVRNISYPKLHIESLTEIIAWWAMHIGDRNPDISVETSKAKEIAIDLVMRAYASDK